LLSHRQQLASRALAVRGEILMPYEGVSLSILDMVSVLIGRDRTEEAAVAELTHAIEEEAIPLLLPDGTDGSGQALYRKISKEQRAAVVAVLREFPNKIPIRTFNMPIKLFKDVRGPRVLFERACRLRNSEDDREPREAIVPNRRFVSDEDLVREGIEGIRSGRWPNALQAATALGDRAEGASLKSIVDRLRKKITAAGN
jgi:hypothetical protein